MSDTASWLDSYDRVLASAAQHLPDEVLSAIARIGRDQRERRAYAGNVLLVALVGGTGSGKSSLLNALAGEEVSRSGAIRPTTAKPLAWVPAALVSRLDGLFERFGITDIVVHSLEPSIAIIDLPDVDSLDFGHRAVVARVLPIIDLVVWVLDPEKYRDRVLHEHLAPLAMHHRRFRFVLNQIDRVVPADLPILVEDLAGALVADGVPNPVIWMVASDPPSGPPIGVDAIWEELLGERIPEGGNDAGVASELRRGLDLLAPHVQAIGFGERWDDHVRRKAAGLWALGKKSESIRGLRLFLSEVSVEAPNIDPALDLETLIGSPIGDEPAVARHLDSTLGRYLRDRLRVRATTRALAEELALLLPPTT